MQWWKITRKETCSNSQTGFLWRGLRKYHRHKLEQLRSFDFLKNEMSFDEKILNLDRNSEFKIK